uniref:Apolipoprotein L3-like isoform X2 n=1 Tax=Geotrypetes seraphini TaxID=260995 RepID=A0A6P8P6E6_GEOSA|nr:apolipoprotein L3-like isoform X2 [Geotrypetes seraphini]
MEDQEDPSLEWDYMGIKWEEIRGGEAVYEMKEAMEYFQNLMKQRFDSFKKCIAELRQIADSIDEFHFGATVASITGSAVSAAGGITSIVGLALIPVTFGASLIVTGVGLGVAALGRATSATATISDTVKDKAERKKVEELVQQYEKDMKDINKCLESIAQLVEWIKKDSEFKVQDFNSVAALTVSRAGTGAISVAEIVRLAQLSKVAGSAARGVQVVAAATGVLAGIFLVIDAIYITKDAVDLHKGAKTKSAAKIRQAADELEEGLEELDKINKRFEKMLGQHYSYHTR